MGRKGDGSSRLCSLVPALVSFTTYLTTCHVDSSSALFAAVFKIPVHSISIYFTKLYSLRCILNVLGCSSEYLVYSLFASRPDPVAYRMYICAANLLLILIARILLLISFYVSPQTPLQFYVICALEGFLYGTLFSINAITPEYASAVLLGANSCRLVIPFVQFIIDLFLHGRPEATIKIQYWISILTTAMTLACWLLFIFKSCKASEDKGKSQASEQTVSFFKTMERAISPLLMFPAGSLFKDFLYPGVLPYAVLPRDRSHTINVLGVGFCAFGSVFLFILDRLDVFREWSVLFNAFWVLVVPICFIFVFTMLAIHTRIPSAHRIVNSKPIVMVLTLSVITYYGLFYPLSLIGVAKVVNFGFKHENKKGSNSLITFNITMSFLYRFFFSKCSIGYNNTRIRLGYHLPKFRPNHRMSRSNLGWFFVRQTFRSVGRDIRDDFRMDVKRYL